MSDSLRSALSSAVRTAGIVAVNRSRGGPPATAAERILARGFQPFFLAASMDDTSSIAAPSDSDDEFPAVTVPSLLKYGASLLRPATVVSGRTHSSASKRMVCLRSGTWMGVISFLKAPSAM